MWIWNTRPEILAAELLITNLSSAESGFRARRAPRGGLVVHARDVAAEAGGVEGADVRLKFVITAAHDFRGTGCLHPVLLLFLWKWA